MGVYGLFVCFDSLHPSQQFFSHVGTGLPGLKQYYAADSYILAHIHRNRKHF